MPNPKTGTVTTDIAKAVTEMKAGKIEFRVEKMALFIIVLERYHFPKRKLLKMLGYL